MAISDRDYARPSPPRGRAGARIGRMGMVSVNTWIIIVNCAVFLAANLALQSVVRLTPMGEFRVNEVTPAQAARAVVDRSVQLVDDRGYFFHPYYDRQTVVRYPNGAVGPLVVGGQRFMYRPLLESLGHFSTGKAFLEFQVWRFITFQFLHADLTHLLFNMLGLWFVGGLVEDYLGRRRYLAYYLACGLFGAAAYLLLNFVGYLLTTFVSPGVAGRVPGLLFDDIYTPLVGASAGVFGVLMAAAYIAPSATVYVLMAIPMKMRTAVYVFLGLATANLVLGGRNAGGDAAHVGGALAGAFLIRRTHLLRDFFDILSDSRKSREPLPESSRIDAILRKVHEHGLDSLTRTEREILRAETAARRGGA